MTVSGMRIEKACREAKKRRSYPIRKFKILSEEELGEVNFAKHYPQLATSILTMHLAQHTEIMRPQEFFQPFLREKKPWDSYFTEK